MNSDSLEKLKNRIRDAVEESEHLRAENDRLRDDLKQLQRQKVLADRNANDQDDVRNRMKVDVETGEIKKRLTGLLRRIDRIEKFLHQQTGDG